MQGRDLNEQKRLWRAGRARGIDAETTMSGRAVCGWHRIKYISPSTYQYNITQTAPPNRAANTVNATHKKKSANQDCKSVKRGEDVKL